MEAPFRAGLRRLTQPEKMMTRMATSLSAKSVRKTGAYVLETTRMRSRL